MSRFQGYRGPDPEDPLKPDEAALLIAGTYEALFGKGTDSVHSSGMADASGRHVLHIISELAKVSEPPTIAGAYNSLPEQTGRMLGEIILTADMITRAPLDRQIRDAGHILSLSGVLVADNN